MQPRLQYMNIAPTAVKAMYGLEHWVRTASGIDPLLLELVRLRASQINGCPYCIDMHSKDAHALGDTEQRLHLLSVWRDCPFYTERERAALLWTEHVTLVSEDHVPDEIYNAVSPHFSPEELVHLTLAIITINGWNRFGVAFRIPPGDYKSKA